MFVCFELLEYQDMFLYMFLISSPQMRFYTKHQMWLIYTFVMSLSKQNLVI